MEAHRIEDHGAISGVHDLVAHIKTYCESYLDTSLVLSMEKAVRGDTVVSCSSIFETHNHGKFNVVLNMNDSLLDKIVDAMMGRSPVSGNIGDGDRQWNILQNLTDFLSEEIKKNHQHSLEEIIHSVLPSFDDGILTNFILGHKEGFLHVILMKLSSI